MFFVISSLVGTSTPDTFISQAPKLENSVTESMLVRKPTNKEVEKSMTTEEHVREYFKDTPIMIHIARCESTFRHLNSSGDVNRGKVNSRDVGVMQINEYYHLNQAQNRDLNIYTIEGNMAYAKDLYEREGTTPWNSSKPCWGKYQNKGLAINTKAN